MDNHQGNIPYDTDSPKNYEIIFSWFIKNLHLFIIPLCVL